MAYTQLARQTTSDTEKGAVESALRAPKDAEIEFALVAYVEGKLTQVVTTAWRSDREGWFQLLGLPTYLIDDIDAEYGVAYVDERGSMKTAGTSFALQDLAATNLRRYGNINRAALACVGEDPNAVGDFAFCREDGGQEVGEVARDIKPHERRLLLELHNIGDAVAGYAWTTPQGVVVATGHPLLAGSAFCHVAGWYQ